VELVEQRGDDLGEAGEAVGEVLARRHGREAEAGQVRRDHVISIGQRRDQVAEHVRRAGEAVEKEHNRRIAWARLAVEQLESLDRGGAVMGDGNR
jgi:hypothetical protein